MYILLYLEFYAPTFTSAKILRAAELFPSSSVRVPFVTIGVCKQGQISKHWRLRDLISLLTLLRLCTSPPEIL